MDKYEQRIGQMFGPYEDSSFDAVMDVLREAVADEREACAKIADKIADQVARTGSINRAHTAHKISLHIRARNNSKQ